MNIRHASTCDRESWLGLRCGLWPSTTRDEHRGEIDAFFSEDAREPKGVLVAERDGLLVGFAELSIRSCAEGCSSDRVAFLEGWYVAPGFRRLGIGRALMAASEQWAVAQGCVEFASDTEVDNGSSRAAHRQCGFEEVATITCFRKELPGNVMQAVREDAGGQVVSRHDAEHYTWGGDCDGWHLLKSPGLSVIQERVPPGRSEVRHYHQRAHQFFFVLSGVATLEVDGRILELGPRQGCSVPPQVPHQLRNEGTADLEFVVVSSPPSHGDRVEA